MFVQLVKPEHPSGNCYISCFLTERTALNECTVNDESEHCLPGQNGIWVKFQNLWPINDGEKWFEKAFLKFLDEQLAIFY